MKNEKIQFKTFADKLAYLIDKKQQHTPSRSKNYFHITHSEIAEDLQISRQTLSNYEKGVNEPTFGVLKKMAKYFDVDIHFLIDDDNKTLSKEDININSILNSKAFNNLLAYYKSKSAKDITRLKTINQLLEKPQMLDNLIELLNSK